MAKPMTLEIKAIFMCHKSVKILNYCHHMGSVLLSSKCTKTHFQQRLCTGPLKGELMTLPRPPSRWEGGNPSTFPAPSMPWASRSRSGRLRAPRFSDAEPPLHTYYGASLHNSHPFRSVVSLQHDGTVKMARLPASAGLHVHSDSPFGKYLVLEQSIAAYSAKR